MKRRWIAVAASGLVVASLVGAGSSAIAGSRQRDHIGAGHSVATQGVTTFEPNANVVSTLRFGTGRIVVASGDRVRWVHRDSDVDPHTITVVRPDEVPRSIGDVFAGQCDSCDHAFDGHFAGGGFHRKVEDEDNAEFGLDGPGDSLWLDPGSKVSAIVSAAPGTRLNYICAIHPWMIGKIKVV